jgi:hypothetical protein
VFVSSLVTVLSFLTVSKGIDPAVSKPNLKHQLRTIIDSVKRTGGVSQEAFDLAQLNSVHTHTLSPFIHLIILPSSSSRV